MKSKQMRLGIASVVVISATILLWPTGKDLVSQGDQLATPGAPTRAPASLGPALSGSVVNPATGNSEAERKATDFFYRKILNRPSVSRIYHSVLDRLPAGADSELVAVYVAESIARDGSSEFAEFMTHLHEALRDRSMPLFDLLLSQEAALHQDPFEYQMTLNLAAKLDLPGDLKARLLGDAMDIHFTPDPRTGVSAMSTNITNALILMKNNGVTSAEAAPYIQRGVAVNRDDPRAASEFAARANTYYPGSVASP
jgi:hypothetical protein